MNRNDIIDELNRRIENGEMTYEDAEEVLRRFDLMTESEGPERDPEDDTHEVSTDSLTIEEALDGIHQILEEASSNFGSTDPHNTKVSEAEIKSEENPTGDTERTKADDVAGNNAASKAVLNGDMKFVPRVSADMRVSTGEEAPRKLMERPELTMQDINNTKLRVYESFMHGMIDEETFEACLEHLDLDNYE